MKHILIIGAASDVAIETAKLYAEKGYELSLAARNSSRLEALSKDLQIRLNAKVNIIEMDLSRIEETSDKLRQLSDQTSETICVVGYLGDQEKAQTNSTEAVNIMNQNYNYPALALNTVAEVYAKKGRGTIIGISSVAGERGRMSNYFYGSSKAGFSAYLSGLRNRMFHNKVHVMTVKPGFMYTKMTENLKLPGSITIHPKKAAMLIYKGHKRQKNTIYISPIWKLIMFVIRNIPETVFKRLKL